MPQHGDYDQENIRWFCSRWMDKKQWLEIHGYSPVSTDIHIDEKDVSESS
ncbi:MAG TPA: hypothetical protein VFU67_06175 [Nitrososphaeraceae archaeon]|nr:hypothetical protein [Nitrososphaeraceae archaeon]